jgi:hypothetical protein
MSEKNDIISAIYQHFIDKVIDGVIPLTLKPKEKASSQESPFDTWVRESITAVFPNFKIVPTGKLVTPDVIIHDPSTGQFFGMEIKTLIQKVTGQDPRGLTIDFNSSVPCGSVMLKVGDETREIPCFCFFALLSPDETSIVTTVLMDGDFLNYLFPLYKHVKYANVSTYGHGPFGEGSVRGRNMYLYPNPLNTKLSFFRFRHTLVVKKPDFETEALGDQATELVIREDLEGNQFHYLIIDGTTEPQEGLEFDSLPVLTDIFADCKTRKQKDRNPSIPTFGPKARPKKKPKRSSQQGELF